MLLQPDSSNLRTSTDVSLVEEKTRRAWELTGVSAA